MADFYEKLNWPLVETAEELAKHLEHVGVNGSIIWQYRAASPCHESESKNAFVFGNKGKGLSMKCHGCDADWNAIEDSLKLRIQYQREGGSLRWWNDYYDPSLYAPPPPKKPVTIHQIAKYKPNLSLVDIKRMPCWVPTEGKFPYTNWYRRYGWRQSVAQCVNNTITNHVEPENCNEYCSVRLLRKGFQNYQRDATKTPIHAVGHCDYDTIVNWINEHPSKGKKLVPSLVMTGCSGRYKFPANLTILDVDYKPNKDSDKSGMYYRNKLGEACKRLRLPCFSSASGNGFHILIAQPREDLTKRLSKGADKTFHRFKINQSVSVDWFMPGAPRFVTLRLQQPVNAQFVNIPQLDIAGIENLLNSGF